MSFCLIFELNNIFNDILSLRKKNYGRVFYFLFHLTSLIVFTIFAILI